MNERERDRDREKEMSVNQTIVEFIRCFPVCDQNEASTAICENQKPKNNERTKQNQTKPNGLHEHLIVGSLLLATVFFCFLIRRT